MGFRRVLVIADKKGSPRAPDGEGVCRGLRRGLIVLGPESTFRARAADGGDHFDKTLGVGLPCVRSDSLSDSNIKYTRSGRSCRRRWCACFVLAVLLIAIGTIAGIYFAYHFMGLDYAHERVFRGVFRVKDDQWRPEFADANNDEYKAVVQEYNNRLDQLYSKSIFRKVFLRSEVLGLDRGTNNTLVVHFNIHINIHRLELDAADLYVVFLVEAQQQDSKAFKGIQIDEDSVEIQERTPTSDVMPPNLESLPAQGATSGGQIVARVDVTTSAAAAASNAAALTSTSTPRPTPAPRRCLPLDVSFCSSLHHNITSYPNLLGHNSRFEVEEDLIPLREVVDSECHPLAFEFICEMLQPDCRRGDGSGSGSGSRRTYVGSADRDGDGDGDEDEDIAVPPCREFCSEVLAACGQRFPAQVREMISCNDFPTVVQGGECTPKPGCARELRAKGWGERVCDGVVDCADMADEDFCPNCSPNSFRCGSGEPCISQRRRCDGVEDCANGSDERGCLSLTPTPTDRNGLKGERWTKYNAEGLLRYTEAGLPSRVCVDNINKTLTTSDAHQLIHNMAEVTCDLLTYGGVKMVEVVAEDVFDHVPGLGYVQISDVYSTNITFEPVNCSRTTVVYMACTELECGVRPLYVDHRDSAAASKGVARTANSGDWPWVAALLKDGAHVCDATLVNPLWLLSTSYCFQGEGPALWTARIGSIRVSSQAPWVQERRIVGMVKGDEPGNQIVLVKLEEAVQQSDYVRPACLGSHTAIPQLYGERCRGLGWGARRDPLVEIGIKVDGQRACAALEVKRRDANYICAHQTSPTDRCIVDEMSGAGLYCERTGRWEVVGVATGRTGCTVGNRPRYYEDVTPNIAKWVRKTIAQFAKKN
ncbi:atrial natriuretic peptide-converting enzyme-like [Oratosquilla oratoria]|uniref:atrial natriuretic peptide-converting enzyme-like n=1 Tax=Oratosquilla oratoria TaxID=337810 RepID=UPI003F7653D7